MRRNAMGMAQRAAEAAARRLLVSAPAVQAGEVGSDVPGEMEPETGEVVWYGRLDVTEFGVDGGWVLG